MKCLSQTEREHQTGEDCPDLVTAAERAPITRLRLPSREGAAKRLFDLAVVIASLPLSLPIMIICGILVRISGPGPILFTQTRAGKNGRPFQMYKFRTMVANAEELKQKYMHLNEMKWPDFKITNDPRVTTIGRFLRRSSLDELPQLLNVLLGDMSIVGPRPTSFLRDTYQSWQTERLEVKPGITGLWQVSGRNLIKLDDRVRLDINYVRNQSLPQDVSICARTVTAVCRSEGVS